MNTDKMLNKLRKHIAKLTQERDRAYASLCVVKSKYVELLADFTDASYVIKNWNTDKSKLQEKVEKLQVVVRDLEAKLEMQDRVLQERLSKVQKLKSEVCLLKHCFSNNSTLMMNQLKQENNKLKTDLAFLTELEKQYESKYEVLNARQSKLLRVLLENRDVDRIALLNILNGKV